MRSGALGCWCVMLVVVVLLAPPAWSAPPEGKRERADRPRHHGQHRPPMRDGGHHPAGDGAHDLLLKEIFPPDPSLREPLDEAGMAALKAFVKEQMPRLYRVMERLEQRDPDAFRRRIREVGPRLRHLQAIYEQEPEVGQLVIEHVQHTKQLRDLHHRLHANSERPLLKARMTRQIRRLIEESVKIEGRIVAWHLERFKAGRDARVEEMLERLLYGEIDPRRLPPEVQDLLDEWTLASDERRTEIEVALRLRAEQRVSDELARWERRAETLAERPEQIVDRRVRFVMQIPPRRGHGGGRYFGSDRGPGAGRAERHFSSPKRK